MDLATLADEVLLGKVEALAETERFTLVDFLIHLGELDQRDACQRMGYSSVFAYLTRHLGYSEGDAVRRLRTARAARRFPRILRMIAGRELHMVGVSMLEPFLTSENYRLLLGQACGKSQREIEKIAAELAPGNDQPRDHIRFLPAPAKPYPAITDPERQKSVEATIIPGVKEPGASPDGLELNLSDELSHPKTAIQETEVRRVFTFTAGEQVHQLFLQARDLLRHKFPRGKMEEIIGEALRRLVSQEMPGAPRKRKMGVSSNSRRIPIWIRDEVWRRDGGRCSYIGPTGIRCAETGWLEYDHIVPWALGGRSDDPQNIRLLCRAHNQSEARRVLGHKPLL